VTTPGEEPVHSEEEEAPQLQGLVRDERGVRIAKGEEAD
jgi:hypothetical protein